MTPKKSILFAKLGHFSYTNDEVANQIARNFPDHNIIVADVKKYVRQTRLASAFNILTECATFGPSVLANRSDLHAYFFRTPFMFRHLNSQLTAEYGRYAADLDFVIQTQGMFDARIGKTPVLVYTDYTFLDNLSYPDHDRRLFRSKTFLRYEAELFRRADAIAVTGSHVERTLVDRYGCDPAKVRTVHVGANVDIRPVATNTARYANKRVLFVGVEWERKGGPALLEGFRQAAKSHPDASLTVVGCSPQINEPNVSVVGPIAKSRMSAFYENASIFAMPSLIEPLGIAAVEASLFRLPVIATRIEGFFETVTDGETGILVPINDPDAIATALTRLFEEPDLARRMGLAGFDRNRSRFNWDEVGKRLRTMAESIAPTLRQAA
jgi:glycosyltransferase involved in cell wall biosynthesis